MAYDLGKSPVSYQRYETLPTNSWAMLPSWEQRGAANTGNGTNWQSSYPMGYGAQVNNSMVGAGYNMAGGGSNLYGSSYGPAMSGGPIYNGGSGGAMSFDQYASAKQQEIGRSGGTLNTDMSQYQPGYQQYLAQAQEASLSPGQRLGREVTNKMNAANAANENRYQEILGGDKAGAQNAFVNWLKSKYPKATTDALNNLVKNPGIQSQYNRENPGAAASFGGLQDRYTRNMGYLEGAGNQQRKDINADYSKLNASQQQDLARRGLLSSTVSQTMQNGVERKKQDSLGVLQESLNRQRLSTDAQISGDILNFKERKQENAPSYGDYTNLMMQLGQSGGGWNSPGYGSYGGGQTGVGTNINGAPMVYGGQQITSAYGVNNSRGLNSTSGYAPRW
jgi:hypothetical protein